MEPIEFVLVKEDEETGVLFKSQRWPSSPLLEVVKYLIYNNYNRK